MINSHTHNNNMLPTLVFDSEEFATSLSFPRSQDFFGIITCLKNVLLCGFFFKH